MQQVRSKKRGQRLPTVLTEAEVEALLAQVNPRSTTGLRNRAMLAAMLGAGLRVSEVVALMPRDIDLEQGTIRVNLGKGSKDRVVVVGPETTEWLRAWREKRAALGLSGRSPVFCAIRRTPLGSEIGQGITARTVQRLIRRLAQEAGIDKQVTPHVLRHTYATQLLDQGCNIREVQEQLGHSDVSTTMIYTHVNPTALREKIQGKAPAEADEVQRLAAALAKLPTEQRQALAEALSA